MIKYTVQENRIYANKWSENDEFKKSSSSGKSEVLSCRLIGIQILFGGVWVKLKKLWGYND